jgi:hypothetical protein
MAEMSKVILKKCLKFFFGVRSRRYSANLRAMINLWPYFRGLIKSQNSIQKRILIIYDLSVQPYSIGDFLLAQVAGLVQCENHNADYADIAIVLNPDQPKSFDPAYNRINKDNCLHYFTAIFPVLQFNKKLGSVFLFNNKEQMTKQLEDSDRYLKIWPSIFDVKVKKQYLHYVLFDDLLFPYWNSHKKIPEIEPIKFLKDWAESFLEKIEDNKCVVTVNFRNNKLYQQERNLNVEVWRNFFDAVSKKYSVVFLIICARNEIDERLRKCPNVIFSKDYDTTIEEDLALISASDIHMGSSSGPATVAWFNLSKPYFIVRVTISPNDFETPSFQTTERPDYYRFCFSKAGQTFYSGEETVDILLNEFDAMLKSNNG